MRDVTLADSSSQPVAVRGWEDRDRVRVYPALLVSGFAALTYEVLWVRLLGELFGHTIYAVQTVLAVFFLGLAAGAWITASTGRRISHPARAFVVVEFALGTFAVLLPSILRFVTPLYDRLAPLETETAAAMAARLFVTVCVLIVPAALMGATFPLAVAIAGPSRVASVYAVNTLGGAVAVWMTVAVALPSYGVRNTLIGAAACNLLAGALMLMTRERARDQVLPVAEPPHDSTLIDERGASLLLFGTGMTALALEFLWTRALEQILSGTVFTFAAILTVFLFGIATGSIVLQATGDRLRHSALLVPILLSILAVAVASTPWAIQLLHHFASERPAAFRGSAAVETAFAGALLLPPAVAIGILFPAVLAIAPGGLRAVGRLTAANTAGSVAGPVVAGFAVLPAFGLHAAIIVFAISYAVLAVFAAGRVGARGVSRAAIAVGAGIAVLTTLTARPLRIWDAGAGERVIAWRDDTAATVAVVARGEERRLRVNNTYSLGGGKGVFSERRQGHLAMFLHPRPRRVLVLGIGTGNTLGAVSLHPFDTLAAVDLLPSVVDLAGEHFADTNHGVIDNPRVDVLVADATRIVRSWPDEFDLIIGDLFHPWQAGVSALYSAEHFSNVRKRLDRGGVFVQWLPLYQLSGNDLRCITRTFLRAFPHAQAWFGNFGASTPIVALVGSESPISFQRGSWRNALADPALRSHLRKVYFDQEVELDASFICDRPLLERFAGPGAINHLDRPVIEFTAAETLFDEAMDREKLNSLVRMVELAAAQDRADTAAGRGRDPVALSNRLGIRAFIIAFVALEQGRVEDSVDAAVIAAEKCVSYDLPRRTLLALGWQVLSERPDLAEKAFRAAMRYAEIEGDAREGLRHAHASQGRTIPGGQ